jgi:tRNA A58 N-methylase Trm61
MLAALSFTNYGGSKLNILVCGTGAGVFTMFLKHQLGSFVNKLVTVDTDKRFVELGS